MQTHHLFDVSFFSLTQSFLCCLNQRATQIFVPLQFTTRSPPPFTKNLQWTGEATALSEALRSMPTVKGRVLFPVERGMLGSVEAQSMVDTFTAEGKCARMFFCLFL